MSRRAISVHNRGLGVRVLGFRVWGWGCSGIKHPSCELLLRSLNAVTMWKVKSSGGLVFRVQGLEFPSLGTGPETLSPEPESLNPQRPDP